MNGTVVAFVVTVLVSLSAAFFMARSSTRKDHWLDKIESERKRSDS
jgi:hypothetical protein